MKQHQGIWFPDGEKHFPEWMSKNGEIVDGKGTYQIRKLREALTWVKKFDVAVDVGGHVGLWSMQLAKRFNEVQAFEPVAEFRECFTGNISAPHVILHACALGQSEGKVAMRVNPADTGGTHVAREADGDTPAGALTDVVPMRTLDSFELETLDFLKIDCEGYEHLVLAGAAETLARCRPCIIVEQKPHKLGPNFGIKGTPAVDLLFSMGARQRAVLSGDYIMSWDQ